MVECFRTIPAMPGQRRVLPTGPLVFALIHPYYSTTYTRKDELGRFPEKMPTRERELFLDEQEKMMTAVWKRAVWEAASQQDAFFIMVGDYNGKEKGIVEFARRQFGRLSKRFEFAPESFRVEGAAARLAGHIRTPVAELRVFGEYTARCVVKLAAAIAKAMQIDEDRVVIYRKWSVDAGNLAWGDSYHGIIGDPVSPVEEKRMLLVPERDRKAAQAWAEMDFEERFVRENDVVFGVRRR